MSKRIALAALAVIAVSAPAHAAVTISTAATQNMNCAGGTCTPTATKAVLNASDLENYLSQFGNVRVMTTGNGLEANNIEVRAGFTTPDSTSLTLEAHGAITINAAVSIGSGASELELQSDTGGQTGTLFFGRKGNITFGSLSDVFGINGGIFTLVGSVQELANAVAANPSGAYAFANPYDASQDGTYATSPISTTFTGTFEGLGNIISNLKIEDSSEIKVGLFSQVGTGGILSDIGLAGAEVAATNDTSDEITVGALAGYSDGTIVGSFASGAISATGNGAGESVVGGLVGTTWVDSTVSRSYANETVDSSVPGNAGGLIGTVSGGVFSSFATGEVTTNSNTTSGGLVGASGDPSLISDSYSTGSVTSTVADGYTAVGGLLGATFGETQTSYSTGAVSVQSGKKVGGFLGFYLSGYFTDSYWDKTTSGTKKGVGARHGNPVEGVTGLTTKQLRSGLPQGFDPKVWAEKSNINNGLPYLIANPPPK
jgi:hypothetical protein